MASRYFHNVYASLRTALIGMRITLKYCFARPVTVQYPDVAPTVQPQFRGFHWYEIEKCSACKACARACPVDCIHIETTGPRKVDRESGKIRGGAMTRWAIDYSKCMFCGLCCDPCPTECLHMGTTHDLSGYTRSEMVVDFSDLAKLGLRGPVPLWMRRAHLPVWAEQRRREWLELAAPHKEEMAAATTEQPIAKPPPKPAETAPPAGTPPTSAAPPGP